MNGVCSIPGCCNPVKYQKYGYCNKHYLRFMRHGDPLAGRVENGETLTFLEHSIENATRDECLIWPYNRDKNGYARFNPPDGIRSNLVCRHVCEKVHGPPPSEDENCVAHSCGKGSSGCFNPFHVGWSSYYDNEHDKRGHGTYSVRGRNGVKLTEHDVRLIRKDCELKINRKILMQLFGISNTQISDIKNRKSWSHVK